MEDNQNEKLKELEEKLEQALDRIEELEDGFSVEDEPGQQDSLQIDGFEGAPFRVHWIDPSVETSYSCSGINTVKKAQEAFAEANAYRNSNGHRVMHGDVLVLMCNYKSGDACYYVGLCAVTNTPNQVSVPNSPDITEDSGNKEFMAWYTCPGEGETEVCDCEEGVSIPELTSESEWHVSLGSCIRFTDLMNLEVYQSDSDGTDLKAFTREITLNKCGEVISISQKSETILSIPCCNGDPDPDPDPDDGCQMTGWAGKPATVTLSVTWSNGNVDTHTFTKGQDLCNYISPGGRELVYENDNPELWSYFDGAVTVATNNSLTGQYTNSVPGDTKSYSVA